tara:strand:- start:573 stop:1883 length:1311 start_codon:yes stop_codon:yes gene_type:complete
MLSKKAKSLQPVGGHSMLHRIYKTASLIGELTTIVIGHDKDAVINETNKFNGNFDFVEQSKALGTADAVKCAIPKVSEESMVLVLYGDVPLIKEKTLQKLISNTNDSLSILSTVLDVPFGYGRVKKDKDGFVTSIIEEKDATSEEKEIKEIFTGVLCCKKTLLEIAINEVENNNIAKEYYLTDIVSIIANKGYRINTCVAPKNEVMGANNKEELSDLENIFREMKGSDLLKKGVTISDLSRLDVRGDVEVGKDCYLDVNVILDGKVTLGDNVSIGPNCLVKNSVISSNSSIEAFSHIDGAIIGENCIIGPYARLREGSKIESQAKVGNFVETKNITLGKDSKANHFTYLGDTEVGRGTNIGAGTITCNYDGENKNKTHIGDNSFIGSNSALVAPVTIGSNTTIAAGSVITKDVPDDALGVGRSKQNNKENWSKKKD